MKAWQRLIRRREPYTGATHAQRLERWLGTHKVAELSANFRDWYGPPIELSGVPGSVFATGGGDFIGECRAGAEVSGMEVARDILKREERRRFQHAYRYQRGSFSSLSALINAATGGKSINFVYQKTSTAKTAIGGAMDLWGCGNQPAAGAVGAAAPTGTSPTNATAGALAFVNAAVNANTSHFVNAWSLSNGVTNSLMLCDRLLMVAKTMSSSATEAVTGTFSRYQNQTATGADYIGGNFCYPHTSVALGATAHNWTVCQYTNQAGTAAQSFPSATGISACNANQVDLAVGASSWFMILASGDVGVKALTQMQCSAVVTGTLDFVVAHPIVVIPNPIVNIAWNIDGVASAFNLTTIFDNACLFLMELPVTNTAGSAYVGGIRTVSE